jgi:hypothetical protein
MWMRYGPWLAQPREIGMFTRPRILLREITASLPYCLYACFTQDQYLNNKSILNLLHPDDCVEALKVLTCTLNSKLISIFYKEFAVKGARQIFPKVVIKNLREFPFPRELDKRLIARLSTLHDRTTDLCEQLASSTTPYEKIALTRQIEAANRTIDQVVCGLYGLNDDQIELLEATHETAGDRPRTAVVFNDTVPG